MGIIEGIKQQVDDNNTRLIDIENKLDKLLKEKSEERKELNPENTEALKEQPQDYKLRPVTESKTT